MGGLSWSWSMCCPSSSESTAWLARGRAANASAGPRLSALTFGGLLVYSLNLWLYLQVVGGKQWPRNNTAAAVRAQLAARCDAVFIVARAQHGHSFEGDSPLTLP